MQFDPIIHKQAWNLVDCFDIKNPNIKPVGRSHNGLEEILNKFLTDRYHAYRIL